jgi:hypothetical protein
VELELIERDQGLVFQHARVDQHCALRAADVAFGRVRELHRYEGRASVVEERDPFLPDHIEHPRVAEDLFRLRRARAAADHELARAESLELA